MSSEWFWAALIIALPLAAFGAAEAYGALRRRRQRALAQRQKGPRRERRAG